MQIKTVTGCVVALRKESVDRNKLMSNVRPPLGRSLSARRAWIEMLPSWDLYQMLRVALRKESVDRNVKWQQGEVSYGVVALRKESVDRNFLRAVLVFDC